MPLGTPSERGELYRFLAGAYLWPPTPEYLAAATDAGFAELVGGFISEAGRAALDELRGRELELNAVHMAWEELFRVPAHRYTKPYESVYREPYVDGRGRRRTRLMGEHGDHVVRFYDAAGADFDSVLTTSRMPDFIGAELAFMQFLCEQEIEASDREDHEQVAELQTLQARFLDEHLARWVGEFCEAVVARDETGYHAALAMVLREHVLADHRLMSARLPRDEQMRPS